MLRSYWADLHIHTVLSPCAEVEMIPPLIRRQAAELGLNLIAVPRSQCLPQRGGRDSGPLPAAGFMSSPAWSCSLVKRCISSAFSIRLAIRW